MDRDKIRSFRKSLRLFERLTAAQLKGDSCCHGVTLAQCHTILEIEALGQATIVALVRQLDLDKSTLSRTIDGLVNMGLVDRTPHPTDRRFMLLSLTPQGLETADRINQSNDAYFGNVFQEIPAQDRDDVINHFKQLTTAMWQRKDSLKGKKVVHQARAER
jgi:DNA-binding MarR family transcriptional regulator